MQLLWIYPLSADFPLAAYRQVGDAEIVPELLLRLLKTSKDTGTRTRIQKQSLGHRVPPSSSPIFARVFFFRFNTGLLPLVLFAFAWGCAASGQPS
jgi:hypothetical protein